MASLNAYLNFGGNCRDAMSFYNECLKGELTIQTLGDSPMAAQTPANQRNNVMHSQLKKGNITLMASDMMAGEKPVMGNMMYLALICDSKDEIHTLFERLSNGGRIVQPLKEEFFGTFGYLVDKFGVNWMFEYGPGTQV